MMWPSNGMGWPMWLLMAAGTLGFWILVAIVVRSVLFNGYRHTDSPIDTPRDAPSMTALDILDRRLATGEISVEEYASRRAIIRGRR
jgi:putative membrane protein